MYNLLKIFKLGEEINEDNYRLNKYTYYAYTREVINYRILHSNLILKQGIKVGEDLPKYAYGFIMEQGRVLMIANLVGNKIVGLVLRSIEGKKFVDVSNIGSLFYGMNIDSDFKYGDWLILVEGIMDRDALIDIYPNIYAILSSGLSYLQKEMILKITDRVVLMYDRDDTGKKMINKDSYYLKKEGVEIEKIDHAPITNFEDSGDMIEREYQGNSFDYEQSKVYYESVLNFCIK